MPRHHFLFLEIVFILVLTISFSAAKTLDGVYHADVLRVYFENDLGPIHIKKTKDGARTSLESFDQLIQAYGVVNVSQWLPTATEFDRDGDIFLNRFFHIYFPAVREDIAQLTVTFEADEHVRSAERIPVQRVSFTPNDPSYDQQWYLPQVNADEAWDMWDISGGEMPGDSSVVIGIVDTGCDWDHPDLRDDLWQNLGEDHDSDGHTIEYISGSWQLDPGDLNGVDDDGNGYADDLIGWDVAEGDNDPVGPPGQGNYGVHMHGTHVAGISAAVTNNSVGIASTGWSIKHMPVKASTDEDPDSYIVGGYDGILYAAKAGADIINCSWGGPGSSGGEQSVINIAHNNYGAIIVAAAGNGDNAGHEEYAPHYPSSYDNVVSVTALGSGDHWNHWATYHETVDLSAPGENILSTVYANVSGGYQSWDGTSMASPLVASCYGLVWSFFPDASQEWVEQRLIETADPVVYEVNSDPEYTGRLGTGRVDVFAAIASGAYPNLSFESFSLQMVEDDGDGLLNPGESAKMRVVLVNEPGWAEATNVTAILSSTDANIIITDSVGTFPDIAGGNTGVNVVDRFEFEISDVAIPGDIPVALAISAGEPPTEYETVESFAIPVTLTQLGFPFATSNSVKSSPAIYDIDADGEREIMFGSDDSLLYVVNRDGSLKWSYHAGNQVRSSPAVADLEDDGDIEIVFASKDMNLYVLNADGSVQMQYEANGFLMATPALKDVDEDGDLEIIFGGFAEYLYVIHHDGSDFGSFPHYVGEALMTAPAVGDVDGNGALDIVVGSWSNNVHAFDLDGTHLSGFPYACGGKINSDPALADLDGDGTLEIIVGSDDSKLHVINSDGTARFTYSTGNFVRGSPAIEDVDGDGNLEIFFGSNDKKLYGLDDNGSDLPNWPYSASAAIKGAPVFFDLDNNGLPEIIAGTSDGTILAFAAEGQMAANSPVGISGVIEGSFCIDDLDGDGDPEIAVGASSSLAVIDYKSEPGSGRYWNMYRGNFHRTGNRSDLILGVGQTDRPLPTEFVLYPNYPNPFNPVTTFRYELPGESFVTLDVYNVMGQHVSRVVAGEQMPGTYAVRWDATNQKGERVSTGIYLVRLRWDDQVRLQKIMFLK